MSKRDKDIINRARELQSVGWNCRTDERNTIKNHTGHETVKHLHVKAEVCRQAKENGSTYWTEVALGLELPPPSIEARLRVVAARVGAGQGGLSRAMNVLEGWTKRDGSPSVIAAACLWEADVCQQNVAADAAGVSATGVRNRVNG